MTVSLMCVYNIIITHTSNNKYVYVCCETIYIYKHCYKFSKSEKIYILFTTRNIECALPSNLVNEPLAAEKS